MSKKEKLNSLQVLRAAAFLEIFLGHCGIAFFTGAFGVSIFVTLSGFCMAINRLSKPETLTPSFGRNLRSAFQRIKKLYGLHLIMLVCIWAIVKMPHSANAIRRFVIDVLLLQCMSPQSADYFSYNGVAWYLSMYLFLSVAAPYVLLLLSKVQKKSVLFGLSAAVFGVMVGAGVYVSKRTIPIGDDFAYWFTYVSPFYRILEFFLGAALGWLCCRREEKETDSLWKSTAAEILTAVAVIGVIEIFHWMENRMILRGICYTALFTPVSLCLVWVFSGRGGFLRRLLDRKWLIRLGDLSAYTFLIHQVVIRWMSPLLDQRFSGNQKIFVLTIGSFLLTVCLAQLWGWLEKRTLVKSKKENR